MASKFSLTPTDGTVNYNRLSILLINGGTAALKSILQRHLFQYTLKQKRKDFQRKRSLSEDKLVQLYPRFKELPRVDKLDDDVVKAVIREIFTSIQIHNKTTLDLQKEVLELLNSETLNSFLTNNRGKIERKKKEEGLISWPEFYKMFPSNASKPVHIKDFDISILNFLLRNLFFIKPTLCALDDLPKKEHVTLCDDVHRIRIYRNVLSHAKSAEIVKSDFDDIWIDLSEALIRLMGDEMKHQITILKDASIDPEQVEKFQQQLFDKREQELEAIEMLVELARKITGYFAEMKKVLKTGNTSVVEAFYDQDENENKGLVSVNETQETKPTEELHAEEARMTCKRNKFKEDWSSLHQEHSTQESRLQSLARSTASQMSNVNVLSNTVSLNAEHVERMTSQITHSSTVKGSDGADDVMFEPVERNHNRVPNDASVNALLPTDYMKNMVDHWKQEDSTFFETKASQSAVTILKTTNHVTITGGPGTGKSFLGKHIAIRLQTEGFDIYPVTSSSQVEKFLCRQRKQVFIFDDPFGKLSACLLDIQSWKRFDEGMRSCLRENNKKLIVVTRTSVARDRQLQGTLITGNNVNLSDTNYLLEQEEKIGMFRKHLSQYNKDMDSFQRGRLEDDVSMCTSDCFPLLCRLFCTDKSFQDDPKNLFCNPFRTWLDTFREIQRCNPCLFCGLVLCCVVNNFSPDVLDLFMEGQDLETARKMVDMVMQILDLKNVHGRKCYSKVKDELDSQSHIVVRDSEGEYILLNDIYKDPIIFLFGKMSVGFVFGYFPSDMIRERVRIGQTSDPEDEEFTIVLNECHFDKLKKRLVRDVKNNDYANSLQNPYIRNSSIEVAIFTAIKEMGKDIDELDSNGMSMLHWSVITNNLALTNCLISNEADVNIGNRTGNPLLITAVRFHEDRPMEAYAGSEDVLREETSSFKIVELLVGHQIDMNAVDVEGRFALLEAVNCKDLKMVKYLLDHGAVVKCDRFGSIVLTMAVQHGDLDIIRLLINSDHNVISATDESGLNAFWVSVFSPNARKVLDIFREHKADFNQKNSNGQTVLMMAAYSNKVQAVELLLEYKVEVNEEDPDGNTALIMAVVNNNVDIARLLIQHGADVKFKNKEGLTACDVTKTEEMMSLLVNGITEHV